MHRLTLLATLGKLSLLKTCPSFVLFLYVFDSFCTFTRPSFSSWVSNFCTFVQHPTHFEKPAISIVHPSPTPRSRLPFSTVSMQLRPLWHLEIHIALEALDLGDSVLTNSTIFASPKKREAAKSISKAMEICLEVSINTQKWPWLEFLGFIALIFISHYCVEEPSLYQRTNSYHESLLKLIQKSCWQASSSGMHLLKMLEEWMNVSQHCLGP